MCILNGGKMTGTHGESAAYIGAPLLFGKADLLARAPAAGEQIDDERPSARPRGGHSEQGGLVVAALHKARVVKWHRRDHRPIAEEIGTGPGEPGAEGPSPLEPVVILEVVHQAPRDLIEHEDGTGPREGRRLGKAGAAGEVDLEPAGSLDLRRQGHAADAAHGRRDELGEGKARGAEAPAVRDRRPATEAQRRQQEIEPGREPLGPMSHHLATRPLHGRENRRETGTRP